MARSSTDTEWESLNVMSCIHCNLKTDDAAMFQAHPCKPKNKITAGISYNLANAKFTCSLCTVELPESDFREHLEGHVSLKPYVCKYCSVEFATRPDACEHLRSYHKDNDQTFGLRFSSTSRDIMQKAKNNGKHFYKPLNVRLPNSNNAIVATRTNPPQNLAAGPAQNIMNAAAASASQVSSQGSTSLSVHSTVPTVNPPVPLRTHSHVASQPKSNTALTSARPQLLARTNLSQNLAAGPLQNIMNAPAASASQVSSLGSTSLSVHVPTVNPPVPLRTHSHVASQPNSNTALTSARPQLPAEQRRYVLIMTQPQTGSVPTPAADIQTQAPSFSSQNVSVPTPDIYWRVQHPQRLPVHLTTLLPGLQSHRTSMQLPVTTLPHPVTQALQLPVTTLPHPVTQALQLPVTTLPHPVTQALQLPVTTLPHPVTQALQLPVTTLPHPVTQPLQSTVSGVAPIMNTRGVHIGANVSPSFGNQMNNSPQQFIPTVPAGVHSNQSYIWSPSIQNTTGTQTPQPALSSSLHSVPESSTVAANTHKAENHLAPAVTASTEGSLRNNQTMSTDALSVVSVNSQNPTESDAGNVYNVNIQHSDKEIKSSVDGDHANGDFAQSVGVQTHQEASSSATEVDCEHSSVAVVKNEDTTDGDTDCPMQIRIENIRSLSVFHDAFQQYVQNNAADTITSTESLTENCSNIAEHQTETGSNSTEHQPETGSNSTKHQPETRSNSTVQQPETGSNSTEHQSETEEPSIVVDANSCSFLRLFKGYFLCIECKTKWRADSDSFFKHIWEKHTHEKGISCCPTGYSPNCAHLKAIVQAIYDRSQETIPDQIKSYFTPTSSTQNGSVDVQRCSPLSGNHSSAEVAVRIETVPQINSTEAPSLTVSVRPSSAPHECEQNMPAEPVSCSIESRSSPPLTLIPDVLKQMIEENQNFGVLAAANKSDSGTQNMHGSSLTVVERPSSTPHECEQNMPAEPVSCSTESRSSLPVTLIPDVLKQTVEENQDFGALTAGDESGTVTQNMQEENQDLSALTASDESDTVTQNMQEEENQDLSALTAGNEADTVTQNMQGEENEDLSALTAGNEADTVTQNMQEENEDLSALTAGDERGTVTQNMQEENQDLSALTAGNESGTVTQNMQWSDIQIEEQAADNENTYATSELRDDLNFSHDNVQSITAIDLSSATASNSDHHKSNNKNTYDDISDDDCDSDMNYLNQGTESIDYSLLESLYSDEMPLDLSKKTQAEKSHDNVTVTPLSAIETAVVNSVTGIERLSPERIETSHDIWTFTIETATTISVPQTERPLPENIRICDTETTLLTTQTPSSTTETPSSTTETPSSTTETPSSTTQTPSSTTQTPSSTTQTPSSTTQTPSSTTQTPSSTTQTPSSTTQTPSSTTQTSLSTATPLSSTAVENLRTRTERLSTESTGMGDDDDCSLRCFYACGICLSSWPKATELEAHIQEVHAMQHDLPCSYCKFRCASSTHLIKHMEDHITINNRKTFSCSLLENSDKVAQFENNDMKYIIRMLKTSMAEDNVSDAVFHFVCNMCQSEFEDLNKLVVHLQESLLKVIGCKHCESFFLNSFSWQKHMATEHVDLPRMYCIKRKLICCECIMYNNLPHLQEDTLCVSNTEKDAEAAVQENQCQGTDHESQTTPRATSDTLGNIEIDASNLINNSRGVSKAAESTEELHFNHEGRDVNLVTGIQAETNPEHISAIPKLLDLVKSSKTIRNVLMSAVSLKTGKVSDEHGTDLDTEPISIERKRSSVAVEQNVSEACTSTVKERSISGVVLHGLMRPVTPLGNTELTETVSEVVAVEAVITTVPLNDHYVTKNSRASSFPVIGVPDFGSIAAGSSELTETRIRLDVSEQKKLEYVPDIGSDIIDNRQESGHSSPADLENRISNVLEESEEQAVSVAVNEKDSSQTVFLFSHASTDGGNHNIEMQTDELLSGIQHTNEATRNKDSFLSVLSIEEDHLHESLENNQKSVKHRVSLQMVKSASRVDQDCKSAHDSEIGMNDLLTEPSDNEITPFTSTMNSMLKTVSYDSDGMPNPVTNSLNPDLDSCHQVDLCSSKGPVCTLQESSSDFVESDNILENDTPGENVILHLNMDNANSNKEEDRCSAKKDETCEILNNNNSLIGNDTSLCTDNEASGEINENSVLNSPSHSDNMLEENNNTAYESLPLVAANVSENKGSSHTDTNELLEGVSIEEDLNNSVLMCKCGTLISCSTDFGVDHSGDKSLKIPTSMCVKCRLVAEESLQPDHTTKHVNSENTNSVTSKGDKLLSEKADENRLQALKRKTLVISAKSKISRLENVNSNDVIRCTEDPPESSSIEQTVQLDHSKLFKLNKPNVASEESKANPLLKCDNCSMFLSESNHGAHDSTISDGEKIHLACKRKSEADEGEGMINSKQMRINSEKHSKPVESIKQLERSVGAHQSSKENQGTDVAAPDCAKFGCSACTLFSSQSYTKLKEHIRSQHPQDKSAKVCRIRYRNSKSAAGQTERFETATLSLKEVETGDLTKSHLHVDITAHQQLGVDSKANTMNYSTVVGSQSVDQQKKCIKLDKLKENVITQISEAARKPLAKVQNRDISVSDSKPCFQCSVCILHTSHSYTEMRKHVKSQHPKDKSAKVIKMHSKCLLSSAEQIVGPKASLDMAKLVDVIRPDLKQFLKCSLCLSGSFHSFTEIKQHIELQHPSDRSEQFCRINSKSPQIVVKKFKSGMCVCRHVQCDFTCPWDLEKMKKHIDSKHPYYSCGYCKAPYTSLTFLKNHLKFLHKGLRPSIVDNTIALDRLFKCVDISCNGQVAECKDTTSQTAAKRKKHSQSSLKDSAKRFKANDSQELNSLQTKKQTFSRICDVNMTDDQQNQPPDAGENEKSKDKVEHQTTVAQALKMSHSTSESNLGHSLRKVSPMTTMNEANSVEQLTIPPKTPAMSKNGDPKMAKTDRNLFKKTISIKLPQSDLAAGSQPSSSKVMSAVVTENLGEAEKLTSDNISSTFVQTVADTPRVLHSESLHTKKTVAHNAASSFSSQPAQNNTSGNKVTEHQKSKSVTKHLGPSLPSQHTVRKQSSATTSKHKNVSLNSETDVKSSRTIDKQESSRTIDKQESSSIDHSQLLESGNRPDNVQETFSEICSETASTYISDTVLLHHTHAAASAVVTPVSFSKTQDGQNSGIWGASQLETKTAAEGDQNKEGLRTLHSGNISIQTGSKTESMCENIAATKKVVCKNKYPIKCRLCSRTMKCMKDIERHFINHHPKIDIKLTDRKSGFVYSNSGKCLQSIDGNEAPTDPYLCHYCAFRNSKRSEVEVHVKSVHPDRKVRVFSMCKPKIITKETESTNKPSRSNSPTPSQYLCYFCKEVKHSEFQFRLHLAEHPCIMHTTPLTTGASFLCHTCGYVANSSDDLAQHTGQHMSERRFKCFMCDYEGHQKKTVRTHIKSFHNKTVDDDVGIIDRCKPRNADFRPRIANIDPKVCLTDLIKQPANYLQKLLLKYGITILDLDGDIYKDMYAHGHDEYNEYFHINEFT